ncbi:MAG TPA: beta-L-arabinofuranosidase domain-containing protein [Terriglobales bacterium]|nr:beta-L-arabinofuranosidase domain-containing protein [Terriglobales bacterium]
MNENLPPAKKAPDTPSTVSQPQFDPNRREFLAGLMGAAVVTAVAGKTAFAQGSAGALNVARVAAPSSMTPRSENKISALNDGFVPESSFDRSHGMYPLQHSWEVERKRESWVQYDWSEPVTVNKIEVYWAAERPKGVAIPGASSPQTMQAPASYRILYWDGSDFEEVSEPQGLGVAADAFNMTTFKPVKTSKVRLVVTAQKGHPAGILEWRVFNHGAAPGLSPVIDAGVDRSVMLGSQTYLAGKVTWLEDSPGNASRWLKADGPGKVTFARADSPTTTALFSAPGDYVLALAASGSDDRSKRIAVHVEPPPPKDRLDVVYTRRYSIDSRFWNERAKSLIVNWIPHCIRMCERTDIAKMRGDGGIDNFIEAGKALRGEPHGKHKGYVFSNAWVHQMVESMCIALMVDANGDAETLRAQEMMRTTLDRWIPIILGAQMPDGYLQTAYTLEDRKNWPERWSPEHRGNHEGYVAGYFIESAINHYTLTDGKDLRLYSAAKKLADCWVTNIGPGKKEWYDGHQEMEQALVRFGRFVNDQEGNHRGDAYIALAKFLLDSRRGGSEYDQSHLPPGQQYEAVGHAVRATYFYSGMADIAAETHDPYYQGAVMSLWDNMVNKKYYVTGGIGSGETSEGFGPNYSLPNDAYCETCSSCGLVFFQYKLNLAYHDAKYADLYEQTMYNALLGGVALDGKSFCYTNPLVDTERAQWHVCPCCVGNFTRTLLMIPTWTYAKSKAGLYVNMFVGSRIDVGDIAGTAVEVAQKTDYPWKGTVAITVNPEQAKRFSVHVRIPDRTTSKLYKDSPVVRGVKSFKVNGKKFTPAIEKGYAVVTREWKAGDRIELELPMGPQRVTADPRIAADAGLVALKYGPLVYNLERADNRNIDQKLGDAPLRTEWRSDLLGGVMVIRGEWADGSEMLAIPNYARMNRVGPPPEYPRDEDATTSAPASKVWI